MEFGLAGLRLRRWHILEALHNCTTAPLAASWEPGTTAPMTATAPLAASWEHGTTAPTTATAPLAASWERWTPAPTTAAGRLHLGCLPPERNFLLPERNFITPKFVGRASRRTGAMVDAVLSCCMSQGYLFVHKDYQNINIWTSAPTTCSHTEKTTTC